MTKIVGHIAAKHESGGQGPTAIGRTAGDPGGASYGRFQMASKTGTIQAFLKWAEEAGYPEPGTLAFDKWWLENADRLGDKELEYIGMTHYLPMRKRLVPIAENAGGFLKDWATGKVECPAVEEIIFATGVQYGAKSGILTSVFAGAANNEVQLVSQCCYRRFLTVDQYFKSSSTAVKRGVQDRFVRSWADYILEAGWDQPMQLYPYTFKGKTAKAGTPAANTATGLLHLLSGLQAEGAEPLSIAQYQRMCVPYAGIALKVTGDMDYETALNILASVMYQTAQGRIRIAVAK